MLCCLLCVIACSVSAPLSLAQSLKRTLSHFLSLSLPLSLPPSNLLSSLFLGLSVSLSRRTATVENIDRVHGSLIFLLSPLQGPPPRPSPIQCFHALMLSTPVFLLYSPLFSTPLLSSPPVSSFVFYCVNNDARARAHTHTHTHTQVTLLAFSHSLTQTHSLPPSLFLSSPSSRALSFPLASSRALSFPLALSLSLSPSCLLTHTHTHTLCSSLSLSIPPSLPLSRRTATEERPITRRAAHHSKTRDLVVVAGCRLRET